MKVPAGCGVIYTPYVMGRNPEIWKDPLKFDHTRFMAGGPVHPEVAESVAAAAVEEQQATGTAKPNVKSRISVYKPSQVHFVCAQRNNTQTSTHTSTRKHTHPEPTSKICPTYMIPPLYLSPNAPINGKVATYC